MPTYIVKAINPENQYSSAEQLTILERRSIILQTKQVSSV